MQNFHPSTKTLWGRACITRRRSFVMITAHQGLETMPTQLKDARNRKELAEATGKELLARFQETEAWQNSPPPAPLLRRKWIRLKSEIRQVALSLYEENAELPKAVTVKWFRAVKIASEEKAREWCFTNFRPALKLDTRFSRRPSRTDQFPPILRR